METLKSELERYALDHGVTLVGIADLTPARDYITRQGGSYLGNFPRAISLVKRISDTVVDSLPLVQSDRERLVSFFTYRNHGAEVVGLALNHVAFEITRMIEDAGYRAYPLFRGEADEANLLGPMSEKIAPHLSGLGWIGKNAMLITPQFGPRCRLSTILTDAPLPTGRPMPDACDTCEECLEICPARAFTGASFVPGKPREALFNAHACLDYCLDQLAKLGVKTRFAPGHVCGLCLSVCPIARR